MTAEGKKGNRSESIRVRLAPDLMTRFEGLSERYGMTPSTLAAFVVGQWVKSQEDQARMSQIALMDAARKMVVDVSQADIAKFVEAAAPALGVLMGMPSPDAPATLEQGGKEGGGEKPAQQSE